jgi:uncharacterized protein (TIGR04222 family)
LQELVLAGVAKRPAGQLGGQRPPAAAVGDAVEPGLVASGLLVPRQHRLLALALPLGSTALLAALCGAHAVVAAAPHGWPDLLLFYVPLFALLGVLAATGPTLRTVQGDTAVEGLRANFRPPSSDSPAHADYAVLVACFGAEALRASSLVDLADLLAPMPQPWEPGCGG